MYRATIISILSYSIYITRVCLNVFGNRNKTIDLTFVAVT